jgi:hypothetical protein
LSNVLVEHTPAYYLMYASDSLDSSVLLSNSNQPSYEWATLLSHASAERAAQLARSFRTSPMVLSRPGDPTLAREIFWVISEKAKLILAFYSCILYCFSQQPSDPELRWVTPRVGEDHLRVTRTFSTASHSSTSELVNRYTVQ